MRLILLTALAMSAFAANSVLNRMAVGQGGMDPMAFALLRLLAGAGMLVILLGIRAWWRGGGYSPGWAGRGVGVAGLLLYLVGFSLAYVVLDAGVGALILFGMVQITMFGGAIIEGEAIPKTRWLGAVLAFVGLVVLVAPGGASVGLWPGLSMALAGIGWGIYSLAGRGVIDPLAATAANFVLASGVAVVLALLAALVLPPTVAPGAISATGIWLAMLSGAVASGMGYALWYSVVPELGAVRAAVAQLTVPVLAALAGTLLLAEPLGLRFVVASVLVLGGVTLAVLTGARER